MTYTIKDLKHLETMADLSNVEPPKPKEFDIQEFLAPEVVKEPSLDEKIISLCANLRADGFDKQASNLEDKFVSYKIATTHLYRVIDEDGEDLVNSAHPDGDVKIEDASNDLGVVETIVSTQKKIVNLVNKQPTGKLAGKTIDEVLLARGAEEVLMSDIAKKFKYMSDYLQSHFLANMPEGQVLDDRDKNFYGIVGAMQETADAIASELNSAQGLPLPQALQMVMNRLMNTGDMAQGSVGFKSLQDVDNFISSRLNWAEDNKPKKLANYVERCNKILKQSQTGIFEYSLYKMWQLGKQYFGSLSNKAEILKDKLTSLAEDNDAATSRKLLALIHKVNALLDFAISSKDITIQMEIDPNRVNPSIIKKYIEKLNELQLLLPDLKEEINRVFTALTRGGLESKLYHYTFSGIFKEAKWSIEKFEAELARTLLALQDTGSTPGFTNGENVIQAQSSLNKMLDDLKNSKLTPEQQQKVRAWVENQQKELEASKNNPTEVSNILKKITTTQQNIQNMEAKNTSQ